MQIYDCVQDELDYIGCDDGEDIDNYDCVDLSVQGCVRVGEDNCDGVLDICDQVNRDCVNNVVDFYVVQYWDSEDYDYVVNSIDQSCCVQSWGQRFCSDRYEVCQCVVQNYGQVRFFVYDLSQDQSCDCVVCCCCVGVCKDVGYVCDVVNSIYCQLRVVVEVELIQLQDECIQSCEGQVRIWYRNGFVVFVFVDMWVQDQSVCQSGLVIYRVYNGGVCEVQEVSCVKEIVVLFSGCLQWVDYSSQNDCEDQEWLQFDMFG